MQLRTLQIQLQSEPPERSGGLAFPCHRQPEVAPEFGLWDFVIQAWALYNTVVGIYNFRRLLDFVIQAWALYGTAVCAALLYVRSMCRQCSSLQDSGNIVSHAHEFSSRSICHTGGLLQYFFTLPTRSVSFV